tara:strand:+ start:685 stop:2964 length:2280 start_codon:yes stop_codon:yes gene_type:complete
MVSSNILIIGSGAREHSVALKLAESKCTLYCISTFKNPALFKLCKDYFVISNLNNSEIINTCINNNIDMVFVGPEKPLSNGIADELKKKNIKCIGPTKNFAKIEWSKTFTRNLMNKFNMTQYMPEFHPYKDETYKTFIQKWTKQFVIKIDGLKGGKGVFVSGDHFNTDEEGIEICQKLIQNNEQFLLEEKLVGEEFSLMSFCDGVTLKHMPPVQDYKRAYANDKGPNTGGMGTVSGKLDFLQKNDITIAQTINTEILHALNLEIQDNYGYKGILYGSFMKTNSGEIKVIEYNCRFGDPESINVLSLLKTSLFDIFDCIINKTLSEIDIQFDNLCTICKYLVPEGYPNKPVKNQKFTINNSIDYNTLRFASVDWNNNEYIEKGSRTIAVIGKADSFEEANEIVEKNISLISGPLFYRKDIGHKFYKKQISYKDSGVDINKANTIVSNIGKHVKMTYNEHVTSKFGSFGSCFQVDNTTLVSSTDGVGTKSILIEQLLGEKGLINLGQDIVNHCVNDILVQGAKPLFFLDYFAAGKLKPKYVENFVMGAALACKDVNCVLIGGETAEMPGVYNVDSFDIVGTIVGMIDEHGMIDGKNDVKEGNHILALESNGAHTNGYSLIRKIFEISKPPQNILEDACKIHKCYYKDVKKIRDENIKINALCHITGGGLIDNPVRVLPSHLGINFNKNTWKLPDLFQYIQNTGNINDTEMYKTFNCGIGLLIIVSPNISKQIIELFPENYCFQIGEVIKTNTEPRINFITT